MRLCVLLSGLVLLVVCISNPLHAQQPSVSTRAMPRGLPRLPGRIPTGSDAGEFLTTTPHWSSSFNSITDSGLTAPSATYDPATNTMMVFAGRDWGMEGSDVNFVLLNAPANGSGHCATLIANGVAVSH